MVKYRKFDRKRGWIMYSGYKGRSSDEGYAGLDAMEYSLRGIKAGLRMRDMPREGSMSETEERMSKNVEKDDFLLSQIDEFREKAKQLQQLVAIKEGKAQELQSIVDEREDKAEELQQILTERREEADKITTDLNKKVDDLKEKVANELEEQIAANKTFLEEQVLESKTSVDKQNAEMKKMLEKAVSRMGTVKSELSEKIHSENVKCYRNIQDLFRELDSKTEKIETMEQDMCSLKNYIKCLTWFSILNFVLLVGYILFSLTIL